jgi:TrmH family RNA methyltransferase
MEGEKIIADILNDRTTMIRQLVATDKWLQENQIVTSAFIKEIAEADLQDLKRISALETPPQVLAAIDITVPQLDLNGISLSWSLALDHIQDPGNLGTIIRTANWFGIRDIICSEDCADCYNPKVVQASMGAILQVRIHYTDLPACLGMLTHYPSYQIYGAFMTGTPVYDVSPTPKGMMVFGNEARGISADLLPFIHSRISVPAPVTGTRHVESLNVASAVAVVIAFLVHK